MVRAILVSAFLAAVLYGCTRDQASTTASCPGCPAISFTADIIPIFQANCVSACHTGPTGSAAGHISLDSAVAYAQITESGTGYVVPGYANYSLVYSELLAGNSLHMPVGGQLDPCSIQKIYCWINQGAKDN